MSLTFGAATTDRVKCGSAAILDDMPQYTFCAWIYPTSFVASRRITDKGGTNFFRLSGTSGYLQLWRSRGVGTPMEYITNNQPLVTNAWNFVTATMTTAFVGGIFTGNLISPVRECTYSTSSSGAGAAQTDASEERAIGCGVSTATSFPGTIAWAALWNRVLTLHEIRQQQSNPSVTPGCVGFWRLGGRYGTATQHDESGYGNHGTVTGATANTLEPPLYIQPQRRIWYVPEVVVAGTAVPVFYRHLQTQGIA